MFIECFGCLFLFVRVFFVYSFFLFYPGAFSGFFVFAFLFVCFCVCFCFCLFVRLLLLLCLGFGFFEFVCRLLFLK